MTNEQKHRRVVTPFRLGAVAAATAAAALIAVNVGGVGQQAAAPPTTIHVVAPNMQTIAQSTSAALTSGVAHVTYSSDNGHFIHDRGTVTVEFTGENRSSVGTQDPGNPCGDASLPAQSQERCDPSADNSFGFANKVVDGRFYLRDGAPGHESWIEDTNEHVTGSDLFSADPRGLLTGAAQDAAFKDAGTAMVDGVKTHHLEATKLDKVPTLNLGLGPITDGQTKITKFDVWVDADNVVRRLDVATSLTETVYPLAKTQVIKKADGSLQKQLDASNMGPSEQRTQVNEYSVTFTDIGSNIVIEAPANARKVAGQG